MRDGRHAIAFQRRRIWQLADDEADIDHKVALISQERQFAIALLYCYTLLEWRA